jgi:hypothetical protein
VAVAEVLEPEMVGLVGLVAVAMVELKLPHLLQVLPTLVVVAAGQMETREYI